MLDLMSHTNQFTPEYDECNGSHLDLNDKVTTWAAAVMAAPFVAAFQNIHIAHAENRIAAAGRLVEAIITLQKEYGSQRFPWGIRCEEMTDADWQMAADEADVTGSK